MSSADQTAAPHSAGHADFSFAELTQAYLDCRRTKRTSPSATAFEARQEANLYQLHQELQEGTYKPGTSTCFVITRPKHREVWAADFRDRIVHHLLYNRIAPRIHASFIADSCACIPERGTLYAAKRLEAKIRSITQNWSRPAYYLKCDLANFFVSIDQQILRDLLAKRIAEPWWLALAETILFHDPRPGVVFRSGQQQLARVPAHKRLLRQAPGFGLPIGNLSSQFFANVFLDALDQYVKHRLRVRHYIRYVDDFIILDESPQRLVDILADLTAWLPATLNIRLNPSKTILQPVDRGVDFVGQVIKPWCRRARPRTTAASLKRLATMPDADLYAVANSTLGQLGQASHSHRDRARLANLMRARGFTVNAELTKVYRQSC